MRQVALMILNNINWSESSNLIASWVMLIRVKFTKSQVKEKNMIALTPALNDIEATDSFNVDGHCHLTSRLCYV